MLRRTHLAVAILFIVSLCNAQFPSNVHRILFLGNSITYAGQYVTDIEAYYTVNYPSKHFEFINVGLPSETVSGLSEDGHAGGQFPRPDLHERLARVLAQTKPDLVFACYGMNDGIYMPFDEERFQKFKDGINWLHNEVVKTGATIIHLTPPVYDEMKGNSKGYAAVLDKYSEWLLSQRKTAKWKVADIHFAMKKVLEQKRMKDSTFTLADDGVHPGDEGHWIMAKQVLLYMGEKKVANAIMVQQTLTGNKNADTIFQLINQQQEMMKDAWLTATKHKRPGMNTGLPLDEAIKKSNLIDAAIKQLLHDGKHK
ncbi:MAG: SGNH/GDSL hydrolase family protein [Chitinophagaceae bacterium]